MVRTDAMPLSAVALLLFALSLPATLWAAGDQQQATGVAVGEHVTMRDGAGGITLAVSYDRTAQAVRVQASSSEPVQAGSLGVALLERDTRRGAAGGTDTAGSTVTGIVRRVAVLPGSGGRQSLAIPRGLSLADSVLVAYIEDGGRPAFEGATIAELATVAGQASTSGQIAGRLLMPSGAGAAGGLIQVCSAELCLPARSGSGGGYLLQQVPPRRYTVKYFRPGSDGSPAREIGVTITGGEQTTLPAIRLPG